MVADTYAISELLNLFPSSLILVLCKSTKSPGSVLARRFERINAISTAVNPSKLVDESQKPDTYNNITNNAEYITNSRVKNNAFISFIIKKIWLFRISKINHIVSSQIFGPWDVFYMPFAI
jgi:hypothetical protein